MRKIILLTCIVALSAPVGCRPQWDLKWPNPMAKANPKPAPKPATEPPVGAAAKTDGAADRDIVQLQEQIRTLRQRLKLVEAENAELKRSNKPAATLRDELRKLTFTAKMQAEDLRVLKTAAIERDLYKTRCERLQRRLDRISPTTTTQPAGL